MKDKDAMEKAAFQYGIQFEDNVSAEQDFIAGWQAAHQGPKVMALVEALKKVSNPLTYDGKLAIEALKEFETNK